MKSQFMKEKPYFLHVFFTCLFASLLMSFIDGYFNPAYIYKTLYKLLLFVLIPILYFVIHKEERISLANVFAFRFKSIKPALILAILVFILILTAYFIASPFIDLNQIKANLINNLNVTKDNFIYVALYISLINSFIEEFFFRVFAFIILKEYSSRRFAYIFSALIFALYHVGMTITWFNPIIFIICLLALFIAGLFFDYLNEKSHSIYPSWLAHMFANFAINTIGLILFNII